MFAITVTSNLMVLDLAVNCLGFRMFRIVHLNLRLGMDKTIVWLGTDRVTVMLSRDMVTVVVRVCLVTRDLCLGQILSYVVARVCLVTRDLCLGQTPDCLTARDLFLGLVLRCHCLISCIKGKMCMLGFI